MNLAPLLLAAFPLAALAQGVQLKCGEEKGTRRIFCVAPKELASNGDLRGAELIVGGPNGTTRSGTKIIVNCKSQISVLQDMKSGTNLGAGQVGEQPAHMNQLFFAMCDEMKPVKVDKKLVQF